MVRSRILPILFLVFFALAGCSSVRQAKPLVYGGDDPRATVVSIEASITKRGYKPICEKRAYCKFQHGSSVWIHFKTSAKKVVMAVDVTDGKKMAADKRQALVDEATAIGEEIWREASLDTQQREKVTAENAKIAAEKKKADEERAAVEQKKAAARSGGSNSGGGFTALLNAASGVLSGGAAAQGNTSATCCVNYAFYDCKTPAAVDKCAGEFSSCVTQCMMGNDMTCTDRCLKEHPPDPSDCERTPTRDAECAQK